MGSRLPDYMPILAPRAPREGFPSRYEEREIRDPVDLCDSRGRLNPEAIGWSRQPLVRANLSGHPLRKKRWNFWNWIDPGFVFSVTLADVDYASFCSFLLVDFERGEHWDGMWLGRPRRFDLPEHVERSVSYRSGPVEYRNDVEGRDLHVSFHAPARQGAPVHAEFVVRRPPGQESLNVVVPWTEGRFQLNSKHNTLPCEGFVRVGDDHYAMSPERCHGVQDWGRGVWPRRSFWNWGVCTGVLDGRRVGINVGARWTTGTGSNENGILIDGRLHKVMEDLLWEYDPDDDRSTWRVRTRHSEAIDLTLEPCYAHRPSMNLGLVATGGVCQFGHWRGRVRVEGRTYTVDSLPGWAEEFDHRW